MSNHLAIATVTAALRRMLQSTLDSEVSGLNARVATTRPNAPSGELPEVGINLFLFQVTPNAALNNADLPTRRGDGTLRKRPSAALDLHYLLSFYGNDAHLEPQILLACAVRALHALPVLSPQTIADTLADPTFSFLAGSDLADSLDRVRFSPLGHSLEETAKIWSIFFQTPYVLSVAYMAGAVLIESQVAVPAPLPVRAPGLFVVPLRTPVVSALLSQANSAAPVVPNQAILTGYTLILRGTDLQGESTAVQIDGADVPTLAVSSTEIRFVLPASLRAGPHSVRVVQSVGMGDPSVPHAVVSSNTAGFSLSPSITASATASSVTLHVTPNVGKLQRVQLLLSQFLTPAGQPTTSYTFDAPSRDVSGAPDDAASLTIPISGVSSGSYLVRALVDGVESPVTFNSVLGRYDSPQVVIP